MKQFSHLDEAGQARMVDVGGKPVTKRTATASCQVQMQADTRSKLEQQQIQKGDVLQVARLAGIMAAKQTANLIPLCHPLPLEMVEVEFEFLGDDRIGVRAMAAVTGQTGVEMEALTAVSVAALTIYDMCKSIDRSMTIQSVRLEEKSGGASGHYQRKENAS